MISALVLLLLSQDPAFCYRAPRAGHGCDMRASQRSGANEAFFEAFNGPGTSGPCSTTAPTGSKGEVLTFTRASNGTCTKTASGGLATTLIADGDLVVLSSNQARVEYDGAGTLGLQVESARVNDTLRSQEFENVYWTNDVVPSVNAATAPDGTSTAERFQFTATTAVQRSIGFVSGGCTSSAVAFTQSLYVRGVSGSGTMDLCSKDLATSACTPCSFVSTSWTRCTFSSTGIAPGYFMFGNASLYNGGTTRSASDVYVWGAQCEVGAYATSYIPTVGSTVTRAEEAADFALSFAPTAGMCAAASVAVPALVEFPAGGGTLGPILTVGSAGSAIGATYWWPFSTVANGAAAIDSALVISAGSASYQPGVAATLQGRYLMRHNGGVGNWTACTNAACTTQGSTATWGTPAFTRVKLDRSTAAAGNAVGHVISRVQIDSSSMRCTP